MILVTFLKNYVCMWVFYLSTRIKDNQHQGKEIHKSDSTNMKQNDQIEVRKETILTQIRCVFHRHWGLALNAIRKECGCRTL